jgi:hypothetical protein
LASQGTSSFACRVPHLRAGLIVSLRCLLVAFPARSGLLVYCIEVRLSENNWHVAGRRFIQANIRCPWNVFIYHSSYISRARRTPESVQILTAARSSFPTFAQALVYSSDIDTEKGLRSFQRNTAEPDRRGDIPMLPAKIFCLTRQHPPPTAVRADTKVSMAVVRGAIASF